MSVRRPWVLLVFAAVATALALPTTSGAALPGGNGRIAFDKAVQVGEYEFENGIWSINPDGSGLLKLAGGEKDSYGGTYSPDGSRFVFGRYDELWSAAADGSGAHVLSAGNDHESELTRWVHNYEDPKTSQIYTWVKIDEQLEERDAYSEPSFSPNGSALAVDHYTGTYAVERICETSGNGVQGCTGTFSGLVTECRNCGSSIDAIDATTAQPLATLVPRSAGFYVDRPSYSGTGALAYEQGSESEYANRQIRVIPASGTEPVVIVSGEVSEPDLSPDGTRVAFASGRHEIGVVSAFGGLPSFVTVPQPEADTGGYSARSPVWSPDGTLIAFADIGASGVMERYDEGGVYLMGPDGSGIVRVQADASVPTAWQSLPLPSPSPSPSSAAPLLRARAVEGKKKLRLSRKGVAAVGRVVCGSSPCALKATGAKLKLGKKGFGVRATLPGSLAAGAVGQVEVKVKGKALAALKARHKGTLTLAVSASDAAGAESLSFVAKLLPPAKKKHPQH